MANLLLPILAGTIPQGSCPDNLQALLVLFANNMQAQLANGRSFYSYGPDKPAPEFESYPWLRTVDGRWYSFTGKWVSPNNYNAGERRWFAGSLTELVTYDGGDSGVLSATSGPMWVEATEMRARFPVGPGTMPSGDIIAVVGTGGSEKHTLTDAEGATGTHVHPIGVCDPASDDAVFPIQSVSTVPSYSGHYVVGGGSQNYPTATTANLFTLPSGAAGAGVTPTPFSLLPPYVGLYCIKPSGRLFFAIP